MRELGHVHTGDANRNRPERYIDFVRRVRFEEIERHTWPQVDWFDFQDIRAGVLFWSDFAVMASGASVFQHPTFLRGLDQLCVDMLLDPDLANLLLDKFTDFYLAYFDRFFTAARGLIDIFRIADDFGMQDRLIKDLFRRYFALALKADRHGAQPQYQCDNTCVSIGLILNNRFGHRYPGSHNRLPGGAQAHQRAIRRSDLSVWRGH